MDRVLFWNRKGEPIEDVIEWAKMFENTAYKNVAVDVDDVKDMHVMVSTIWTGLPTPAINEGPYGIFETALLIDGVIQWSRRHNTEEEALTFHREATIFHLHKEPTDEAKAEIVRREEEARATTRKHQSE